MANDHPKFEDDVPQFSGKINETFVEWVADVKLWEAEHKDEAKPCLGPRFPSKGFLGQPEQIIKKLLGHGDLANAPVDNIIETLRNNGEGDTLGEKGQEALDNYFDTKLRNAEAIRIYMMSLSLQKLTNIARDEKMRGYWHIRTSASSEQDFDCHRKKHWTVCCDERNPDGRRKFAMTVVNKKTEPVTRWAVLLITLTPSLTVRNLSQRQIWQVSANRTCGTRPMTKPNTKQ